MHDINNNISTISQYFKNDAYLYYRKIEKDHKNNKNKIYVLGPLINYFSSKDNYN